MSYMMIFIGFYYFLLLFIELSGTKGYSCHTLYRLVIYIPTGRQTLLYYLVPLLGRQINNWIVIKLNCKCIIIFLTIFPTWYLIHVFSAYRTYILKCINHAVNCRSSYLRIQLACLIIYFFAAWAVFFKNNI